MKGNRLFVPNMDGIGGGHREAPRKTRVEGNRHRIVVIEGGVEKKKS